MASHLPRNDFAPRGIETRDDPDAAYDERREREYLERKHPPRDHEGDPEEAALSNALIRGEVCPITMQPRAAA